MSPLYGHVTPRRLVRPGARAAVLSPDVIEASSPNVVRGEVNQCQLGREHSWIIGRSSLGAKADSCRLRKCSAASGRPWSYSLTGLKGDDPPYSVTDMTLPAMATFERIKDDILTSEILKLDATVQRAVAERESTGKPLSVMTKAALESLKALGPKARLVFFMTS